MNKIITWSIISHKQGKLIDNLLSSFQNLDCTNFQFIITINIPEDLSFLDKYSNFSINLIENNCVKGFGENHNYAFSLSNTKLFAVLNPDTQVASLDIIHIREIFKKNSNIGALTVKCFNKNGIEQDHVRKFPNLLVNLLRFLNLYTRDNIYVDRIQKIDWASGSFLIFDRKSFKNVGGFDENFFLYFEDVDICRRLKIYGYDVMVTSKTSFIHETQRNSRKNIKYFFIHLNSMIKYYFKSYNSICNSPNITFICINLSYFLSHRMAAYKAAIDNGLKVSLICNVDVDLINTKELEIDIYNIDWKRNCFNLFEWIKNIYNLRKIMKHLYPNIVHCIALHSIFFYTLTYPLSKKANYNIFALMGFGFLAKHIYKKSYIYYLIFIFFKFLTNRKNDFYQVQNLNNEKLLINFGISKNKIKIIPGSGVKTQKYKKNYSISPKIINIGFAGRLLKIKGIETLLLAFEKINEVEKKFNLNIVGKIDELNPSSLTSNFIENIKKNKKIKFLGFKVDVLSFWKNNDIAVFPSHYGEGIPKALLEAASMGMPIITSDSEGCIDFANNGETAIITKSQNCHDLSSKIMDLSKNFNKRKSIGRSAQNLVEQKYSFNNVLRDYKDHYLGILKNK